MRAAPLILVGLLLLVSIWWDGAFDLRYWSPLALLAVATLVSLAVAGTLSLPRGAAPAVSVAAIWALAAFAMLSAAWAESPGSAWEGAARTAFYASLFTLAVCTPVPSRSRLAVGGGLVLGVAVIAFATELRLLVDGTGAFLAGRLDDPIGYRNGTAALFAFAAWPLIGVGARRGMPAGVRSAAFAAVVLVLGLAFLTQSRGVLLGLVAGGLVSLAIGPDRLRRAWVTVAALAVLAVGSGPLLTAYDASGEGVGFAAAADVRHAALALLLLAAGSFLVALFAFVFDNGLRSRAAIQSLRNAAVVGMAAVVAVAAVAALARVGNPVGYAGDKLDEFTRVDSSSPSGATRFGSVSGQRYDLWRIALDQFENHPVAGAGEGSYRFAYFRERQTDRNVAYTHSLPMRLLAETGLVGFGLFLVWLGGAGVMVARRARSAPPATRVWTAGLAAAGTAVIVQSWVDWLWLIPSLFGLGVLALGLAAAGSADANGGADEIRPPALAGRAAGATALLIALLGIGLLFLSGVYVRKAREQIATSPRAALSSARTAGSLDPLSVTPLYLQASALETLGRRAAARRTLREALQAEPGNFVTLGVLGDLEVRAGNESRARGYYRRAAELNPRDVGLRKLSRIGTR